MPGAWVDHRFESSVSCGYILAYNKLAANYLRSHEAITLDVTQQITFLRLVHYQFDNSQ